jgi:hypothetical protein
MVSRSSEEDRVGKQSVAVTVTTRERGPLEPLARARTAPQRVVERCRIILLVSGIQDELGAKGKAAMLERSSFTSLDDLRSRTAKFIDFNDVLAKPFRWTYTGRPLRA